MSVPFTLRYPHQEEMYNENPAAHDYELMLGHSALNFEKFEDFMRLTNALIKGAKVKNGQADPAACGSADSESTPDKPKPKPPRCTRQQKIERMAILRRALVEGVPMPQLVKAAKLQFKIGKRSVQLYVKEIREKWATEAGQADYLAHLWQSKLQREELYHIAYRKLQKEADPKVVASLLRQANVIRKDRDHLMASVLEHRQSTQRDKSPDSAADTAQRQRIIQMPFDEWFERLEHMRNLWWYQWNTERKREAQAVWEAGHPWCSGPPDFESPPSGTAMMSLKRQAVEKYLQRQREEAERARAEANASPSPPVFGGRGEGEGGPDHAAP